MLTRHARRPCSETMLGNHSPGLYTSTSRYPVQKLADFAPDARQDFWDLCSLPSPGPTMLVGNCWYSCRTSMAFETTSGRHDGSTSTRKIASSKDLGRSVLHRLSEHKASRATLHKAFSSSLRPSASRPSGPDSNSKSTQVLLSPTVSFPRFLTRHTIRRREENTSV